MIESGLVRLTKSRTHDFIRRALNALAERNSSMTNSQRTRDMFTSSACLWMDGVRCACFGQREGDGPAADHVTQLPLETPQRLPQS